MLSLADEILRVLPAAMLGSPKGATARQLAELLAATEADIRAGMKLLDLNSRAMLLRYRGSKLLHLAPLDFDLAGQRICANCRVLFVPARKSKARNHSRSCAIAWSWSLPGVAERRSAGIRAERATPEGAARTRDRNARYWNSPEHRKRLSEWNRARWADPAVKAQLSTAIQAVNGSPEKRSQTSQRRKAAWADPEGRKKMIEGIRRSRAKPEVREKFSEQMKARWRDPVLREKFSEQMKARWRDPVLREKYLVAAKKSQALATEASLKKRGLR